MYFPFHPLCIVPHLAFSLAYTSTWTQSVLVQSTAQYSIVWVFQLYNQASVDRHLGCLQSSAVTMWQWKTWCMCCLSVEVYFQCRFLMVWLLGVCFSPNLLQGCTIFICLPAVHDTAFLHSLPNQVFSNFWYCGVISLCIYLVSEGKHLFINLWAVFIFFLLTTYLCHLSIFFYEAFLTPWLYHHPPMYCSTQVFLVFTFRFHLLWNGTFQGQEEYQIRWNKSRGSRK